MPESPKIICVTPTCRPESHAQFVRAWEPLFAKHRVTLVTVWDGEEPQVKLTEPGQGYDTYTPFGDMHRKFQPDLFCRFTDACRNLGFVVAARMNPDFVLTLDDDCHPIHSCEIEAESDDPVFDPIQAHLDALSRRVPLSWMNTAHDTELYLRGVPYGVRDEAPAMLSHGVWVGTPDFDGETQLRLELDDGPAKIGEPGKGVPHSLPYFVGPVPRGVLFPLCGMNVMVKREALPYLYYAPMGPDSGADDSCPACHNGGANDARFNCRTCGGSGLGDGLNRFADIFMGVCLKREFDRLNWACVTGYSTVLHSRASDSRKNFDQEKLGREWMEAIGWQDGQCPPEYKYLTRDIKFLEYFHSYADKRARYAELLRNILKAQV